MSRPLLVLIVCAVSAGAHAQQGAAQETSTGAQETSTGAQVQETPPGPQDASAGEPDTTPKTLQELIATALRQRANLHARQADIEASEEVPSRVGSPPDPTLMTSASNLRFNDPGLDAAAMSGITVGLTQGIPFPGKLRLRAQAARATTAVLERVLTSEQARVALSVERAYWDLWLAQESLTIISETERVLDQLANAVVARFSVGEAAQQDALQVQAAHSSIRSTLIELRQRLLSAARATERTAGLDPAGHVRSSSEPPLDAVDATALRERLARDNPETRLQRAQVEARRAQLTSAHREQYPDFMIGAGYRFRREVNGDPTQGADMFSVSLGITLPVFLSRNQAARVRELESSVEAAREDLDDTILDVRTALERALDAIGRVDAQLSLYRGELLPETDAALGASIEDYQFGRVTLNTVLENWRVDLTTRLEFERLRALRARQSAILHALLGENTSERQGQ